MGWLIFRAGSLNQAWQMIKKVIFDSGLPSIFQAKNLLIYLISLVFILILVQLYELIKKDKMAVYRSSMILKIAFYLTLITLLTIYGVTDGKEFIYFQF